MPMFFYNTTTAYHDPVKLFSSVLQTHILLDIARYKIHFRYSPNYRDTKYILGTALIIKRYTLHKKENKDAKDNLIQMNAPITAIYLS